MPYFVASRYLKGDLVFLATPILAEPIKNLADKE
jgi:hypothetical protein